ncbi:hypothetical protein [Fibrobacter sp. UWOV1]|uniref:hypothetical protein n=1 Tax=Fibrobacter sp. UWOV1 TaxID=1896215 RepID=UPI001114E40C|nr:hypothetical protein [Fibrobacter sp. UWOV1]
MQRDSGNRLMGGLKLLWIVICLAIVAGFAGMIRIPQGAKDIFPCYEPHGHFCKIANYASSTTMPMDGALEFVENKVDCFYGEGHAYIIARSNAPEQIRDSVFWGSKSRCYDDNMNCGNLGEDVEVPRYTKKSGLYFYSCKNSKAAPNGCKPVEKGMEILETEDLKISNLSRDALLYYFKASQRKSLDSLMAWLLKNHRLQDFYQTLPWGLKDEDVVKAGNSAAPRWTGMDFYLRTKKIESKSYKRGNFSSFADVMKACKDWGMAHEAP